MLTSGNAFEVKLTRQDKTPLAQAFISQKIPDLKMFKISPSEIVKKLELRQQDYSSILLLVDFEDGKIDQTVDIEFSPDYQKFTCDFVLSSSRQTLKVQVRQKLDPEKLESDKRLAEGLSGLN